MGLWFSSGREDWGCAMSGTDASKYLLLLQEFLLLLLPDERQHLGIHRQLLPPRLAAQRTFLLLVRLLYHFNVVDQLLHLPYSLVIVSGALIL